MSSSSSIGTLDVEYSHEPKSDHIIKAEDVKRIMKKILPPDFEIEEQCYESVRNCLLEFICIVCSEAHAGCLHERRTEVSGTDVVNAMKNLGMDELGDVTGIYLQKFREKIKMELLKLTSIGAQSNPAKGKKRKEKDKEKEKAVLLQSETSSHLTQATAPPLVQTIPQSAEPMHQLTPIVSPLAPFQPSSFSETDV